MLLPQLALASFNNSIALSHLVANHFVLRKEEAKLL